VLDLVKPLSIRSESPQDHIFLEQLYCESREDLHALALEPEIFQQLMLMQMHTHQQGVQQRYPNAQSWMIISHEQTIGRLVIDETESDLRLVDIAVSVTARGKRVAQNVLQAMQNFASLKGYSISLSVSCSNHRALNLYRKCGFWPVAGDSLFWQMRWDATSKHP
jgi:ribosomal protein S18 acetylase RimI-like enzyme